MGTASRAPSEPELGVETAVSHIADLSAYPFIDASRNHVIMNDADWTHLRARFSGADTACVRILHIGDSHIQAEGSTSRVRYHLQQLYGGAAAGSSLLYGWREQTPPPTMSYAPTRQ